MSSTNRAEKYLDVRFLRASDTGKTGVFEVVNRRTNYSCGEIRWYGGFRKYCFFPASDTLFDSDGMRFIEAALIAMNENHKKHKTLTE